MSAIMSRPQCANVTHLRRDLKQMSCLQSKVFWVVHRPETQASDCLGGWMVYRPPYPIITQQIIHFKAWIFPLNTVDSLIFFYLYVADILIQYICWNHWKNWKIKDSRCRLLTRPSMRTWVFSDFFFWLTTKCPHAVPKCKQLSYEYIWPTLATYNKSCDWCEVKKKQTFQQEPRGRFLSGVPDYFGRNKISSGGDLSHYSSASLY